MGQKVYLASRFGRQAELREIRAKLQADGVEVTSSWLDVERDEQQAVYTDEQLAAAAAKNLDDIARSDVLIAFTDRDAGHERGGHHVELGYAFAEVPIVILVGPRINVFHWNVNAHWSTVAEFLADWNAAKVPL